MFSEHQCSVITRALFTAFCRYRARTMYSVAEELRITLINGDWVGMKARLYTKLVDVYEIDRLRKEGVSEQDLQYSAEHPYELCLPAPETPRAIIRYLFWHEIGHIITDNTGYVKPHRVIKEGEQAPGKTTYHPDEWPVEWWCNRFALLMTLTQAGAQILSPLSKGYLEYFQLDLETVAEMKKLSSHRPQSVKLAAELRGHLTSREIDSSEVTELWSLWRSLYRAETENPA